MLPLVLACAADPAGHVVRAADWSSVGTPATGFTVVEAFLPGESTGLTVASAGLAVVDVDGDDRLDIFLPSIHQDQLFLQAEDGSFAEADVLPFDDDPSEAASAADYDNDGDIDLFVAGRGIDHLLRNDGGSFSVALGLEGGASYHTGATWGDVDVDGDLDLAVLTHSWSVMDPLADDPGDPKELWEQTDDGWVDHGGALSGALAGGYAYGGGLIDLDGDGLLDLYYANDFGPQQYPNQLALGDGAFSFAEAESQLNLSIYAMGAGVGDLNGDGRPDLLISDWSALHLMLSDGGDWYDGAIARGLYPDSERDQAMAWAGVFADVDNDGDLDAAVAYGHSPSTLIEDGVSVLTGLPDPDAQPDGLYLQDHDGGFVDMGEAWGAAQTGWSRGTVAVDLNRDGAIDLVKRDINGGTTLLLGRPDHDHWIEVAPRRQGVVVGAIVDVDAGARHWRRWVLAGQDGAFSCGPPEVHVGLGAVDRLDHVRVTWPDGTTTTVEDVDADQRLVVDYQPD